MAANFYGGSLSTASTVTSWASSTATTSGSYSVGYDPYKTKKKRIMIDKHRRDLKVGQLIMTGYFSVGLIVNFTAGGNPRCIAYDEQKEELAVYTHKPWNHKTKKIGDIMEPCAWTDYRCYILREVGDPRTVLPPGLVIQRSPLPF